GRAVAMADRASISELDSQHVANYRYGVSLAGLRRTDGCIAGRAGSYLQSRQRMGWQAVPAASDRRQRIIDTGARAGNFHRFQPQLGFALQGARGAYWLHAGELSATAAAPA